VAQIGTWHDSSKPDEDSSYSTMVGVHDEGNEPGVSECAYERGRQAKHSGSNQNV